MKAKVSDLRNNYPAVYSVMHDIKCVVISEERIGDDLVAVDLCIYNSQNRRVMKLTLFGEKSDEFVPVYLEKSNGGDNDENENESTGNH